MDSLEKILDQSLTSLSPYLKTSMIGTIALAIIIVVAVVFSISWIRSLYLAQKQKKTVKKQQSQNASTTNYWNTLKSLLIKLITNLIQYFGFLNKGSMLQIFEKANNFLKLTIGGRNYAYSLPRYLLVGASNSGKASLLDSLNIRVVEKMTEVVDNEKEALRWWFFDTGSFLKIPGEFFIKEEAIDSAQNKFNKALSLLLHFRVQKPIDGILLTIPADELTTLHKLDINSLILRAQYVRTQLNVLQKKLGYILPIYITITKCDLITGFKEFTNALPAEKLNDIFGWSSSFSLSENYSSTWIDFAFDYIQENTLDNQLEVFLKNLSKDDAEKIILLVKNISNLREPLKTYLNILFKKKYYQDAFYFRGIYLTSKTTPSAIVAKKDEKKVTTIGFIHDLVFNKIFPECRIALPSQQRLFSISKSTNIARFVMIFLFLGWGTGLWFSQEKLYQRSEGLEASLVTIHDLIKKQPLESKVVYIVDGIPLVDENSLIYTITSLSKACTMLGSLSKKSFSSIFIPSSWVSPINLNLKKTVGIIIDRLIFLPIYYSLIYKLRLLAVSGTLNLSVYNNETALFSPLSTPEFLMFRGYVETAYFYENVITAFSNLSTTLSISDVSDIILFLFNMSTPKDFKENKDFYSKAIKYSLSKNEVPIKDFTMVARQKVKKLFKDFIKNIFINNPSFDLLKKTATKLDVKGGKLTTLAEMSTAQKSMSFLFMNVSLSTFSWINKFTFDPGPAYTQSISIIDTLKIFGGDSFVGDSLRSSASSSIPELQIKLSGYWSDSTGNLLKVSNNHVRAGVSSGFINLYEYIKLFEKQSFMRPVTSSNKFISAVPAGKYLIWNVGELDAVKSLLSSYKNFIDNYIHHYPKVFQSQIKLLAQESLNDLITSSISRAQTLVSAPSSVHSYSLENAVRVQVDNINKSIPTFENILTALDSYNLSSIYLKLRNLLVGQVYDMLLTVDTFFNSESFYDPLYGNYSWWKGSKDLNFKAYNVQGDFALSTYLKTQHKRIIYLSTIFAEPLVAFLTQSYLHLESSKINLIAKWQLIIDQTQAYTAQKPNNSILKLEQYLLNDVNKLDSSNCFSKLSSVSNDNNFTGNWFSQKELTLKKELYAQCQKLISQKATDGYTQIEEFFNSYLAGKYPFVGGNLSNIQGEASPDDIRVFFTLYNQYKATIDAHLSKISNSTSSQSMSKFIKSMEKVKTFFSSFLDSSQSNAVPNYKLTLAFRTNQRFESNANQILTWTFSSGNNSATNHANKPSVNWQYGESISLDLQWVSNGPFSPAHDPKQAELLIHGNNAIFSSNNPWALLKFVELYKSEEKYLPQYRNKALNSLKFTLPLQSNYISGTAKTVTARLFVDVVLEEVKKKGGTKVLSIPYFPATAPSAK